MLDCIELLVKVWMMIRHQSQENGRNHVKEPLFLKLVHTCKLYCIFMLVPNFMQKFSRDTYFVDFVVTFLCAKF